MKAPKLLGEGYIELVKADYANEESFLDIDYGWVIIKTAAQTRKAAANLRKVADYFDSVADKVGVKGKKKVDEID